MPVAPNGARPPVAPVIRGPAAAQGWHIRIVEFNQIEIHPFVEGHTGETAQVYTDDGRGYIGMDRNHESVNHGAGEYVRGMAHTNGVESFWSTLERGHKGTFHKFSRKHLQRYVGEFAGRHNSRNADTVDQMGRVAAGMDGKRLTYRELKADNGLPSGVRG